MAVKTQAELQTEAATSFANNTAQAITRSALVTYLTNATDTAEDRWGVGDLATSPAVSPSFSEAQARINGLLASEAGTAYISPADLRGAINPILDIIYPKT